MDTLQVKQAELQLLRQHCLVCAAILLCSDNWLWNAMA
jgi:hypothetical protein